MSYAYITGGASGIGRAIVEMLVKNKYGIRASDGPGLILYEVSRFS
jgi:NAD(P)-dependent dehydrogenase (short-subunit alcohol dehydrogenase family)